MLGLCEQVELLVGQAGSGTSRPSDAEDLDVGPCRRVSHHTSTADTRSPNSIPITIVRPGLGEMGCLGTAARSSINPGRVRSAAVISCMSVL
jgi:hypothetical protein